MGSISGVSGMSNAWDTVSTQRSQIQARLFSRIDTNSSGSLNQTKLSDQGHLDSLAELDADRDGQLSQTELATGKPESAQGSATQGAGRGRTGGWNACLAP